MSEVEGLGSVQIVPEYDSLALAHAKTTGNPEIDRGDVRRIGRYLGRHGMSISAALAFNAREKIGGSSIEVTKLPPEETI